MKFNIELTFYKNDENIHFGDIPDTIQKDTTFVSKFSNRNKF